MKLVALLVLALSACSSEPQGVIAAQCHDAAKEVDVRSDARMCEAEGGKRVACEYEALMRHCPASEDAR